MLINRKEAKKIMRETKPLNYRVDDAITEAYEKMLGVEDLVEEVEESPVTESIKEVVDLPIQVEEKIESYVEEPKEDSDDIPVAEKENEIVFERKKYMITQGIANAFRKPDLLKGNMIVKKVCEECHFHMPSFAGRYPDNCPLCGTPFKVEFKNQEKVKEKIAVYEGDKCLFVAEEIKEGKFKEISLEIDMIIDDVVSKVKSKELKNNRDLMKLLKDMKSGKNLPSGVRKSTVQDNFSKIAAGVANKLRKERIKF